MSFIATANTKRWFLICKWYWHNFIAFWLYTVSLNDKAACTDVIMKQIKLLTGKDRFWQISQVTVFLHRFYSVSVYLICEIKLHLTIPQGENHHWMKEFYVAQDS